MLRTNKSLVNNLEKFSNDSTNRICFTIPFNKKFVADLFKKENKKFM